MGNPRLGLDSAVTDKLEDAGELAGDRVARGEQRELAAMKQRVVQGHGLRGDADVDHTPTEVRVFNRAAHAGGVSGGIEYHVGRRRRFQGFVHLVELVIRADEFTAARIRFDYGQAGAGEPDEFDHAETDGARANHEHPFGCIWLTPVHGVAANGEGLHQSELVGGEIVRGMQLVRGDFDKRTQSTVAMHTEHLQSLAAVCASDAAHGASATIQVRLDRAAVARFYIFHRVANSNDLYAELMAENARV